MSRKIAQIVAKRYARRNRTASSDQSGRGALPTPDTSVSDLLNDPAFQNPQIDRKEKIQFKGQRLMVRASRDSRPTTLVVNIPVDDPNVYVIKKVAGSDKNTPGKGATLTDIIAWVEADDAHEIQIPLSPLSQSNREAWVSELDMNRKVMLKKNALRYANTVAYTKEQWGLDE